MVQQTHSNPSSSPANFVETGCEALQAAGAMLSSITAPLNPIKNAATKAAEFGLGAAVSLITNREGFTQRIDEIAEQAKEKIQQGREKDRAARSAMVASTKQWIKDQVQETKDGIAFQADLARGSLANAVIEQGSRAIADSISRLPVTESTKTLVSDRFQADSSAIHLKNETSIADLDRRAAREEISLEQSRSERLAIQKGFAVQYTQLVETYSEAVRSLDHRARKDLRRTSEADRESGTLPDFTEKQVGRAISDAKRDKPVDAISGFAKRIAPALFSR